MSRDKFFDNNPDFVSPQPQPPSLQGYSPYTPYYQQQPQYASNSPFSYSTPSNYQQQQQQQYDRQLPFAPTYNPSEPAYYSTAGPPSPSLSQRPSLADRYTPVGSEPTLLSRSSSNVSEKGNKRSSACSYPCCGFRSGRTLCGCCMCFLFLIVAAIAAVFLLAKAPEITFQSLEPPSNGLPGFAVDGPNFAMNFNLKIAIKNANLIGVTVSKVMGEAKFPVSNSVIGKGNVTNLSIPKQSDQVVLFPFQINYDPSIDPESKILLYVAKQCGLLGGTKGKLEINYSIKLSFGFLATLGIVPSFDNKVSFDCPLDGSQLPPGLGSLSRSATASRRRSLPSRSETEVTPSVWLRSVGRKALLSLSEDGETGR